VLILVDVVNFTTVNMVFIIGVNNTVYRGLFIFGYLLLKFFNFCDYIRLLGKRKCNIVLILFIYSILVEFVVFIGCANQQPPGGGEEDKIPPKLIFHQPAGNSLNFTGNSLILEFDEYVDNRSFQDAFHISPPYKGEVTFEWSGKEVEIVFEKPLWMTNPNKTFVVTINSVLTDIRGNKLTTPISFAFSTGPKIDMSEISGQVFNNNEKQISVLAYKLGLDESDFDPTQNLADFITETSSDGKYNLTNLSPGKYRLLALDDEDLNMFYTSERESFGVLSSDIALDDSAAVKNINFYLKIAGESGKPEDEIKVSEFFKDSLDIVYSSVENNSRNVLPGQSIFFFFNKNKPARGDFVNSFSIKTGDGVTEKIVFNWKNDSLVEIFPPDDFSFNKTYDISFKINISRDTVYNYNLEFRTVTVNSFGEINGVIKKPSGANVENLPVYVNLTSRNIKPEVKYDFSVSDTVFSLKSIFEADYGLFSYIDKNLNGIYDFGNPYPFDYSEQFFIYPQSIGAKGGWVIENVFINFR
jgi:hypothetical protein